MEEQTHTPTNGVIIDGRFYLISNEKVQDGDTVYCVAFGYVSRYEHQQTKFGDKGIADLHYDRVKFENGEEYVYWPNKFKKLIEITHPPELLEQLKQLKEENERLKEQREEHRKAMLGMADYQKSLTEQVEKLKKEKQDLQLAFNIMNDPGKELTRLREREKELEDGVRKYVHHMNRFFGEPKVGQPPSLSDLESLLSKVKQ